MSRLLCCSYPTIPSPCPVAMHHAQAKGLAALGAGPSSAATAAPVAARPPTGGGGSGGVGSSGKAAAPFVDARVGRGPTVPYPFSSGIDEDWASATGACRACSSLPFFPPLPPFLLPPTTRSHATSSGAWDTIFVPNQCLAFKTPLVFHLWWSFPAVSRRHQGVSAPSLDGCCRRGPPRHTGRHAAVSWVSIVLWKEG